MFSLIVLGFESRYHLRYPTFWIMAVVFFAIVFFLIEFLAIANREKVLKRSSLI